MPLLTFGTNRVGGRYPPAFRALHAAQLQVFTQSVPYHIPGVKSLF